MLKARAPLRRCALSFLVLPALGLSPSLAMAEYPVPLDPVILDLAAEDCSASPGGCESPPQDPIETPRLRRTSESLISVAYDAGAAFIWSENRQMTGFVPAGVVLRVGARERDFFFAGEFATDAVPSVSVTDDPDADPSAAQANEISFWLRHLGLVAGTHLDDAERFSWAAGISIAWIALAADVDEPFGLGALLEGRYRFAADGNFNFSAVLRARGARLGVEETRAGVVTVATVYSVSPILALEGSFH